MLYQTMIAGSPFKVPLDLYLALKQERMDAPKPCGRGWVGTKPPGCTRASGKGKNKPPAAKKEPKPKSATSKTRKSKSAPVTEEQAGGGLAVVAKPKSEESSQRSKNRNRVESVTEKYASANPTTSDAKAWIREVAKEYVFGTDPDVLTDATVKSVLIGSNISEGKKAGIKTKEQFVDAQYKADRDYWVNVRKKKPFTPKDSGLLPDPAVIARAEKSVARAKTPEAKAKAQVKLDKVKAKYAEDLAASEAVAKRLNEKYNASPKEAKKQLSDRFEANMERIKAERTKERAKVDKLNDAQLSTLLKRTHTKIPEFDDYLDKQNDGFDPDNKKSTDAIDAAQRYLKHSYMQGGGSSKILGLSSTQDLTANELKSAYRKAVAKAHPDKGGSSEKFRQVQEAYESLKTKYGFDSLTADLFLDIVDRWDALGIDIVEILR